MRRRSGVSKVSQEWSRALDRAYTLAKQILKLRANSAAGVTAKLRVFRDEAFTCYGIIGATEADLDFRLQLGISALRDLERIRA